MNQIIISEATLSTVNSAFTFKEKIEIARQLEKLKVDYIELPEIKNIKSDTLFIRTVSSFIKESVLSVAAGSSMESIDCAFDALNHCENGIIRIELPLSPVRMEYDFHKKPQKMLEWIEKTVSYAAEKFKVDFSALDATRAEPQFLEQALKTAENAGASFVTLCDDTGEMFADDFAKFAQNVKNSINLPIFVDCSNKNGIALAAAVLTVKNGTAVGIKTSVSGDKIALEQISSLLRNCGEKYGISSHIRYTQLHRIVCQIERILENALENKSTVSSTATLEDEICLDKNDDKQAVDNAVVRLGYDLSSDDRNNVYKEFMRVADKKTVGAKELDAIVISTALQVPATYKLENYIVNSGNSIASSAQVALKKDDELLRGISIGDGPIDAAFHAIEQIIGSHFELDDFQIQTVTEGKEAIGSAVVKLRSFGKIFSGNGVSTDIIEASIRAYISALNKIVYEEV